jgi:hypothetical protein
MAAMTLAEQAARGRDTWLFGSLLDTDLVRSGDGELLEPPS